MVTIYVAEDNIQKDTQITEKQIKKTSIAKQFILTKPLLKKEIINKFAKETIYKNEAFLKEKLSLKIEEDREKKKKNLIINIIAIIWNLNYLKTQTIH